MSDTDIEIAGARLSTVDRPATAPTPADRNEQAAAALYDAPKGEPPDPGSLYSTGGLLRDQFNTNLPKLGDAGVLTYEQQQAERAAFPAMLQRTGLDPVFGRQLHDLFTARRLEFDDDERADRITATTEATHRTLREQYAGQGIKGQAFEDLKQRVGRWVNGHPDLKAITDYAGIGRELEVAEKIFHHVWVNGLGR